MDPITVKLNAIQWKFADADPAAKNEMARRIADVGRREAKPIYYSDLVRGITLRIPTVHGGEPFELGGEEGWMDLHRAVLGDFLGSISADTYRNAGFWATALVVAKADDLPSPSFFKWMVDLGVLPDIKQDTIYEFWAKESRKAYEWYAEH